MKPIHWKPDCPSKDHHKDIDACMERIDKLEAVLEAAIVILPMAKGYAFEHPVGRNAEMVSQAEQAIALAKEASPLTNLRCPPTGQIDAEGKPYSPFSEQEETEK